MDYETFLKHHCDLDVGRDIVDLNTPPGFLYRMRVWLRRWTMSSDTDQLSRMYLKSNYMIRLDRKRHYNLYFWTIHPLSDSKSTWEIVYMIMFMLSILAYPFTISARFLEAIYVNLVLDVLFLIDIFLNFYAGYINKKDKSIVLDSRQIAKRYLLSYFIVDFVAAFPLNVILIWLQRERYETLLLRCLRLVRIITILQIIRTQKIRHGLQEYMIKILHMILLYSLVCWVSATVLLWNTFSYLDSEGRVEFYKLDYVFVRCLLKSCYAVLLVASDKKHDDIIYFPDFIRVLFHSLGFAVRLLIITFFLEIICSSKNTESRFKVLIRELEDYCRARKLPEYIWKRLVTYYTFRFQSKFYNEPYIQYALTLHLRKEIHMACVKKYVASVDIFSSLPEDVIIEIGLACQEVYFLPGDVLVEHETPSDSLYMITSGTVALYDRNGKEFCHLEDNCYFGEMSMLFNVEMNMPTTIAISCCQIIVLKKKQFELVMKKYKDELDSLYNNCNDKLQVTMFVMQQQGYEFIPPQIVVQECLHTKK